VKGGCQAGTSSLGKRCGGSTKLGHTQHAVAVDLYRQKKHTIDEFCKAVGTSRPTLYK
jgi:hypothetical protein